MCVWTSFSLFLVTNSHLELPNRSNLHLNIGSWSPEFPSRVPEVPRIPKKVFLLKLLTHIGARFGIDLGLETSFLECFPHNCFCTRCEGNSTRSVSTK